MQNVNLSIAPIFFELLASYHIQVLAFFIFLLMVTKFMTKLIFIFSVLILSYVMWPLILKTMSFANKFCVSSFRPLKSQRLPVV